MKYTTQCPDFMVDPEGYNLWCEANICTSCNGDPEQYIEDEWNEDTQQYGKLYTCVYCNGTGIDPSAVFDEKPPEKQE